MSNINVTGQQAYFNEDAKFFKDVYIYGTLYYEFESKTKEIFGDIEVLGSATFNGPAVFKDVYIYGTLYYEFESKTKEIFGDIEINGSATFNGPAVFNDSVGIGTTNSTSALTVTGNALISGIITASQFVGGGSDLRNISGTHIVSYASHSETSNSALSIAGISTYNQVGILTGSLAGDTNDRFGTSVATSADGKTIIVGANFDEIGSTSDTGVVYVYDRVGNSFNQVGILTGSLAVDTSDNFGNPVATSADGKTIIVGAFRDEIGSTSDTGVVYVYDRVGNSFNQVGILTGSLAVDTSDNFGYSVATSADGKTIVVGAVADEIGANKSTGVVYVFDRQGNSFNQVGILTGSLAVNTNDLFGNSVATSADGKTIVVGAFADEQTGYGGLVSGVVYVYDRVGNSFNQVGILTGSLAVDTSDNFGHSVATSADGKTIIVGAIQDEIGDTTNTGVVYVFDRQGNSFNQVGILTGSLAGDTSDNFGYSVATSADGKTIIVGANFDEIGDTTNTGVVYVFDQTRDTYVHSGPTGSIGIGTANPTSKLHVVGDTKITGKILNNSGNTILNQTGSILQVVHTQLTTSFSGTSTQTGTGFYIDVTGLSATITPTSSSNKILILTNMYIGNTTTSGGYQQHFRIKRNGTAIILGAGEGGRPTSTGRINMYNFSTYSMMQFSGVHYDSPASTSALTYQIELGGYSGSPIVYVNRSETWQNAANDYDSTPVSTLTLMEVSG